MSDDLGMFGVGKKYLVLDAGGNIVSYTRSLQVVLILIFFKKTIMKIMGFSVAYTCQIWIQKTFSVIYRNFFFTYLSSSQEQSNLAKQ